ncbi:MAG TPA: TIGR03560 family F420-dependent LLM class oxidoreductase [Candidatus Limnocylindria bacterium]|nr:TIGR03560 family F420-dependent LLM class oxidoreductase [Candidatus Limnocylindria bacterium]
MKLGVIVSPSAGWSYAELQALARGAEASGFDSFWVSDHFFGGQGGTPDRNCLEAWTLLAALARDTERIRLGVLVAAVQYRSPALQAKIAAGVDHMSGGRLEFGVGAGWKEDEYRAYGYDFPPPGQRVEQLRDGLEITRRLWSDDRATYHGKHYRIDDAVCAPKPVQRPRPPIWIGGAGPRVMRLAARYADGFDLGKHGTGGADLTPEEMAESFRELESMERAANREAPLMRSHWSSSELDGDGQALVEKIRAYGKVGLDQYLCAFPKERAAEMIERSRERLVPAFA